uniref:Diacylglycerol kinase n=1 Tax=Crassostrea virginica TaxID=6565 RepID=A0A8B8A9I0_CRAVI|nr:diacylglycerol kinase theta-like isoform X3 [Crassostrea virginica]XP_022333680.1 diacylglycerol kinase theta-like isoform X3 [Crassostrea virginica]
MPCIRLSRRRVCLSMENSTVDVEEDKTSGCMIENEQGHGHSFIKKTFHKPTYCHHCTLMLWGLIGQGYVCEVCNFVVHERCLKLVVSACSSIATTLIKNPVAHCFSTPSIFKRKFCDVCRKRLEDSPAIRCELCEYYAHVDCQDFVVSNCKECATYTPDNDRVGQQNIVQYHHWREGNLPANSKCVACKKTCWSSECMAGMRCEWCGVTSHASCYRLLPAECNFGSLRDIMLPPSCLTVPRINISMDKILGINVRTPDEPEKIEKAQKSKAKKGSRNGTSEESDTYLIRPVFDDCPSSGDSKNDDEERERKSPREKEYKDKDKDPDLEVFHVYDGDNSLKEKRYRTVSVPKNASFQSILEAALKTFHISDDPKNYYVSEVTDSEEKELDENSPIRSQLRTSDEKRPSIFLRYRELDSERGLIKVYPGVLRVSGSYKNIEIDSDMTCVDVIREALQKFGVEDVDPETFNLIEVLLDKGVNEQVLPSDARPWQILQKSRKDSLQRNRMTRFYLKQKEDPHGPSISLFVGNLPTGWAQRQYEKLLLDFITPENKWSYFDVIYYEYGSLVLIYNSAEHATDAFNILSNSTFDQKPILALLLPNIQSHMILENVSPLLVFVNAKSGGCQGSELITSFRKLLNPHQVFNLENGGPLPGLYVFRHVAHYKILACGGDGTVGWVLSCLDNVGQDAVCQSPPLAIVPLGTGNDLARVLRWGPGYTGGEDPLNLLRDVIDAEEIKLDRWTVIFHPNEKEQETKDQYEDTTSIFVMNNYFGIGIDAEISLDFHTAREERPGKFQSRIHNKGFYFKMGLQKMVKKRLVKDLHRHIRLEVDGRLVELPPVEGIIILNILSWGSGSNPWGPEREDQFAKPTHYDGMLEVVGVTGVVHMGQIQSSLRAGIRIAQGGHLRITLLTDIPVQVDGEPWVQPAGQVVVLRSALKATMLKKSKKKMRRRNTEPSIFFPDNEPLRLQSPTEESEPL